eukprot:CAMPEP_0170508650 /NCGR_PEP_ID=MMETSP0208-20121228/63019_1 /TAXON_ID=197538 /ORGANISM="Strombidium inclinatum, Strain S3" /LENGTH=85 /DNA_ID=CAMNT_0010791677 /DNA_START=461 /DNA_END=718 /DNA_ORIENTATION=-
MGESCQDAPNELEDPNQAHHSQNAETLEGREEECLQNESHSVPQDLPKSRSEIMAWVLPGGGANAGQANQEDQAGLLPGAPNEGN